MVKKILLGLIAITILFVFVGCSKVDYITCEDGTAVTDFSLCPEYIPPPEPQEEPNKQTVVEDITPGVDVVAEVEEPEPELVEAQKQQQQIEETKKGNIKCFNDGDCGNGELVSARCQFSTSIKTYDVGICVNPGKTNSYCKPAPEAQVIIDCGGESSCSKGECVIAGDCHDKDRGKNYKKPSTTIDNDDTKDDYCLNETTLVEYFCNEKTDRIDSVEYTCPRGCKFNACS